MKLYTCCEKHECEIECENNYYLKLVEYSFDDYKRFLEVGKRHHIHLYRYWYETDMSDSSSGSANFYYPINYLNMIIKDNNLAGVLVSSGGYGVEYYFYALNKEEFWVDLAGGYNENSYTWKYKENNLEKEYSLDVSINYALIVENLCISIKEGTKKVTLYERKILGILQKDCLVMDREVFAIRKEGKEFLLGYTNTYIDKQIELDANKNASAEKYCIYTLVKLDEEFLNKNITEVTYRDFREGNYEIYTKLI